MRKNRMLMIWLLALTERIVLFCVLFVEYWLGVYRLGELCM